MSSTANLPKVTVHVKEGAALIRKALKASFPKTKFSVCMSPGGAIRITYTDGPLHEDVKSVAMQFGSKNFNGQTDCPYQTYCVIETPEGLVQHSIYAMIFVDREYSDEAMAKAKEVGVLSVELSHYPAVCIMEKYGCRVHSKDMYDARNLAVTYLRATDFTNGSNK
jgi:hypothetical protein